MVGLTLVGWLSPAALIAAGAVVAVAVRARRSKA
jgi:cytochrome c-type biogenesis protein CcmH/NrfF